MNGVWAAYVHAFTREPRKNVPWNDFSPDTPISVPGNDTAGCPIIVSNASNYLCIVKATFIFQGDMASYAGTQLQVFPTLTNPSPSFYAGSGVANIPTPTEEQLESKEILMEFEVSIGSTNTVPWGIHEYISFTFQIEGYDVCVMSGKSLLNI